MSIFATVAIIIVAAIHVYIAYIEMLKWVERGNGIMPDFDEKMLLRTKPMAANQGLYNLFLVAGLVWAIFTEDVAIALCFLLFVLIAGVFGGITLNRKPFVAQAVPAAIAIATLYLTNHLS